MLCTKPPCTCFKYKWKTEYRYIYIFFLYQRERNVSSSIYSKYILYCPLWVIMLWLLVCILGKTFHEIFIYLGKINNYCVTLYYYLFSYERWAYTFVYYYYYISFVNLTRIFLNFEYLVLKKKHNNIIKTPVYNNNCFAYLYLYVQYIPATCVFVMFSKSRNLWCY